jgi:putative hydrolase of the HAD superfamily
MAGLSRWDAIVFDLGGVLLELDYERTSAAFEQLAGRRLPGLYSKTEQNDLFDRFERGQLDAASFRAELRRVLWRDTGESVGTPAGSPSDAALDAAWNALLGGVPAQNVELLLRLRGTHRVYLLSNTNAIHIEAFFHRFEREHGARYGLWSELFHRDYYSHRIGHRKPDAAIFQHVLREEGLTPERTLFIDDNWHNVLGAREVGLDAAWLDVLPQGRKEPPGGAGPHRHPVFDGARNVHELLARLSATDEL